METYFVVALHMLSLFYHELSQTLMSITILTSHSAKLLACKQGTNSNGRDAIQAGIHTFSKNPGVISKFLVPEG
jgi:hypothetical protein